MFRKMVPVNLIRDYEAQSSTATLKENKVSNASKIMAIRVVGNQRVLDYLKD